MVKKHPITHYSRKVKLFYCLCLLYKVALLILAIFIAGELISSPNEIFYKYPLAIGITMGLIARYTIRMVDEEMEK